MLQEFFSLLVQFEIVSNAKKKKKSEQKLADIADAFGLVSWDL